MRTHERCRCCLGVRCLCPYFFIETRPLRRPQNRAVIRRGGLQGAIEFSSVCVAIVLERSGLVAVCNLFGQYESPVTSTGCSVAEHTARHHGLQPFLRSFSGTACDRRHLEPPGKRSRHRSGARRSAAAQPRGGQRRGRTVRKVTVPACSSRVKVVLRSSKWKYLPICAPPGPAHLASGLESCVRNVLLAVVKHLSVFDSPVNPP